MVTNASFANIPYLGLPGTGVTHLGGRTQVFTTSDFGSTSGPNMIFGNNGAAQIGCNPSYANVKVNPYAVVNQAQSMLAEVFNKMASSNIDSAMGGVTTQKNQLISMYNSGSASNELKTVIQEQVRQLEEYERQLNYLKANAGQLDPQTAYQRSEYIKNGVANLINLSTTTIKAMTAQATQAAQQAQQAQDAQGEKPEEDSLEAKAEKVKNDNIYTRAGEENLDSAEVNNQYYNTMIDNMYNAMKGWGTDDKALEAELDKINKENVIDVIYRWNEKHPEESFMEMFMADADASQKKKYGVRIADAIEAAAKDAGIDLSNDEDMLAIKKEVHNSWFFINNDIADNYNNLVKRLLAGAGIEYNFTPYSMFSK